MSSNKLAKQVRIHNDARVVANRTKVWKQYQWWRSVVPTAKQSGKMRKHHPLNCGNTGCMYCGNARHLWGRVTFAELKSDIGFKEMKDDYEGFIQRDGWEDYVGFGESIDEYDGI